MAMQSKDLLERLLAEVRRIPIIDCHTHLRWDHPAADDISDIFGYHYIMAELLSAGMPHETLLGAKTGRDRIREALPYLTRISNTATWWGFEEICRTLFGLKGAFEEATWEDVFEVSKERCSDPVWHKQVIEETLGVKRTMLTNSYDEDLSGYDRSMFVPALRIDPLVLACDRLETVQSVEKAAGMDVGSLSDFKRAVGSIYHRFRNDYGARSSAISMTPQFPVFPVHEGDADRIFDRVLAGTRLSHEEFKRLQAHLFYTYTEFCRDNELVFQIMLGVDRAVYLNPAPNGGDLFSVNPEMLKTLRDLLNRYPDVTFDLCILNRVQMHELAGMGKLFPNCVISGHWWFTFYPGAIRETIRERLEMIPVVKLNGFFSDSYYCEWTVAKVAVYTRALAECLSEKVEQSYFTEDQAIWIARRLLYDNPIEHFGLPDGTISSPN